jgi:hypothetical protein
MREAGRDASPPEDIRDTGLVATLSGILSACCVGTFTDAQLRQVIGQWIELVRRSRRGVPDQENVKWGGETFQVLYKHMSADSTPEVQKLVKQLGRMFHEGQWAARG